MKKLILFFVAAVAALDASAFSTTVATTIETGQKYFIYNTYYKRYLGTRYDKAGCAGLTEMGTYTVSHYIFEVEKSNADGYVWLKQSGTGKYLKGSNTSSDTWSLLLTDTVGKSDNTYNWKLTAGSAGTIVNKNNSKYLGVDKGGSGTFIGVYYNKSAGELSQWQFYKVDENDTDFETTNSEGVTEHHTEQVKKSLTLSSVVDYHISGTTPIADGATINLTNERAWLVFENVRPSKVVSTYLSKVKINGAAASEGTNCRVAIWLDGAVVIPQDQSTYCPFYGYSGQQLSGDEYKFYKGKNDLDSTNVANNRIQSFVLKRGYMATISTTVGGEGYSRVFVADHEDLTMNTLPTALNQRISHISIKKWNYCSKKGWSSTEGQSAINTEGGLVKSSWFYNWACDKDNQYDMEYVPINGHWYWPSVSSIAAKTDCTHMLGLNEPEHSEQHEDCSCNNSKGGTTSAWNACTLTPRYQTTDMRVGSPAPTDASWLEDYTVHVDNMAYRCDFVAFHAYWGTNEAKDVNAWYSQLKAIHDATDRPIWLTEWNNGASWTNETKPNYSDNGAKMRQIINMLEDTPWIERYCVYNWDDWHLMVLTWDSKKNAWWVNPAGQAYRDARPHFAYNKDYQKVPNWWGFSIKEGSDNFALGTLTWNESDYTGDLQITNTNIDQTATLTIEIQDSTGNWTTFREVTEREYFDNTSFTLNFDGQKSTLSSFYESNKDSLVIRITMTDIKGKSTTSDTYTFEWPSWMYEATAISAPTTAAPKQVYDLGGRKVLQPKKGKLYIEDGQKRAF